MASHRRTARRLLLCWGLTFAAWCRQDSLAFHLSPVPSYHQLSSSRLFAAGRTRISVNRHPDEASHTRKDLPQTWKRTRRKFVVADEKKFEWLQQATDRFVSQTKPGSLTEGKWHEVVSVFNAWSSFQKSHAEAAVHMEALLKVLVDERRAGNTNVEITMDLYNNLLDAWACAAHFQTVPDPGTASQRAREILVTLQEKYEQCGGDDARIQPNAESFRIVLRVVTQIEGALTARRFLAWMEHLHKTGKNAHAAPTRSQYLHVLDAYAHMPTTTTTTSTTTTRSHTGVLAEAFLRHMQFLPDQPVDTFCYNIAIKAWTKGAGRNRREAAEHADRILEEMKASPLESSQPDVVTYASVISAWAASGMKVHAVSRAEELLREIEASDHLEANTVVLNAIMSAWVKARNPAAVDRTEEILRQMEASKSVKPDLVSYNTYLHALSMHASPKRPELAQRADELLRQMEEGCDSGQLPFCPNVFSYNLVIEAFCRTPDANTATHTARLLRTLVKRDGVDPDSFSFNQVLASLSKSQAKGSANTAEELLRYMDKSYKSGIHPNARPDATSFACVISAYTRSGQDGSAEHAQRLLDEMKERSACGGETHLTPTTICYNSLIDCWAKSGAGTMGARKAEALLQEMREMFDAGEKISPNLISYNGVLNAWARSGTRCSGSQAEKYLKEMWELYNAGDKKVKPNDFSYNTVINAISKSKHESKGQKALRILRRMEQLYLAGNMEARPNEITYTAVINSCAFPSVLDSRTRRKALDTALFTLKELQASRYGQPNQVTYGTFIKACANLLHDDEEMRRAIIQRVFRQCCKDGQLGAMVLNYTPRNLQRELLADYVQQPNGRVSIRDLPAEWRRNVSEKDTWRPRRKQPTRRGRGRRSRQTIAAQTKQLKP